MKKAIASMLAASMALSLAACGGSSTATSSSTATESTASSTTAESTASGDKVTLRMTYWNSEDTVTTVGCTSLSAMNCAAAVRLAKKFRPSIQALSIRPQGMKTGRCVTVFVR